MDLLLQLIAQYGLVVVFVSVLLDQGGVPVPAYPAIVVTAAMAVDQGESVWPIVLVATLAAVLADWVWFLGGRLLGTRLVRLMCRMSLSPDSCVIRTRGAYSKYGPASLIVAKFIPGFAAVATTLAGQTGTRTRTFLLFDGIGAALWAGGAVLLGVVFEDAVDDVLADLADLGHMAIPAIVALIAAYIGWKWWRRQRFLRELRMARITPAELGALIDGGHDPVILDVRGTADRERSGWIPGAQFVATAEEAQATANTECVVYCDCPDELSAAVLARALKARGFSRVRPLAGGFAAWCADGRPVEGV